MDTLAHGLWAGAAYLAASSRLRKQLRVWRVVVWGIFPDLFAFTPTFVVLAWHRLFGDPAHPMQFFSRALRESLPVFLQPHILYPWSHSLIIFALLFAIVWFLGRRAAPAMLAWPLHILMDIPSHRAGLYGTPFLWPISSYRFNGVSWGQRWFMILNYTALAAVFVVLVAWRVWSRQQRHSQPGR